MNVKKGARLRRAKRARSKISKLRMNRLCVFRSPRHIYAQVISPEGDKVLASASTVEKENRTGATGNVDAAGKVGKMIAERAKAIGERALRLTGLAMPIMVVLRRLPTQPENAGYSFKESN